MTNNKINKLYIQKKIKDIDYNEDCTLLYMLKDSKKYIEKSYVARFFYNDLLRFLNSYPQYIHCSKTNFCNNIVRKTPKRRLFDNFF